MTPSLRCSHMYFPLHLRSPTDLISLWFVFRTEEKSWIWQALNLESTLTQAVLLLQIILEASNTSSPRETSVPKFSLIPQGNSFCKRLWLFLKLSLILSSKKFCGIGTLQVFPLPLHPDVSGSQDVHLWSWVTWDKSLSFIYSREECDLHIQMFKMVILFSGTNCKTY